MPARPLEAAIVDVARTTGVSIGGVAPQACAVKPRALQGRLTAPQAMERLVRGSRCRVVRIDATTLVLEIRPAQPHLLPAPPPPAADETPTQVIVTANRRPQRLGEAPFAISLVTPSVIANGDGSLSAVATRVPGLTLTNLGAGRDKILLRGISDGVFTGRTQSTVGLYLDDTPITFNAPDPDLLLVDMARIEVLRGPQGALYGEGSISGVVRLVTNRPALDTISAMIEAGAGLSSDGAPSSRVTAMVNMPLLPDRLAVRAVAYNDQAGGYIDDIGLHTSNTNATHRYGGRMAARWRINDTWQAQASFATQEINAKNSQYVEGGLGAYRRRLAMAEPHDNDFSETSFSLGGKVGEATLRASVNHLHHHIQTRYDASSVAGLFGTGTSGLLAYDEGQRVELETEDVSLTSAAGQRLRWLVGVFASQSREDFTPHLSDLLTGAALYDETRRDRIDTLAGFGEASFDLTQRLTVTGGLRLTAASHQVTSATAQTGMTSQRRDDIHGSHLSHQVTIRYRAGDALMLYAQAAEGYRDGGFNTTGLAGFSSAAVSPPPRYVGDELNSYEAGIKLDLPDRRLRVSTALYRVFWRDIQSDQLQASGLPVTVNIGNGLNTGLEVEGDWRPWTSLTLHAATLINEPRLTRPNPLYATAEDSGLPFIARRSFSLSTDWQKTIGAVAYDAGATLSYRGVSHLNFGPLQTVEMGGYGQLDLTAGATIGRMRYGLRIDNAGNANGNSFAYGNPFSLGTTAQITPPRPATLWLTVRFVK